MACPRTPITDEMRVEVTHLAQQKKAPFHNKNNSVGDALILLSAVQYLEGKGYDFLVENSIFISNNSDDYCETRGSSNIHPDLRDLFHKAPMRFETNLARALYLSNDIVKEIDEFNEYMNRDIGSCLADCKGSDADQDIIWYKNEVEISLNDNYTPYNPNQIRIDFGETFLLTESEIQRLKRKNTFLIKTGHCEFCNCFHLRCDCDEELFTYNEEVAELKCNCGKTYIVKNDIITTK